MSDDLMQLTRIEQLLQENLEAAQETNDMIRDMRRTARWGFWLKVLVWAAVIILPFLLLKPILETFVPAAAGSGTGVFGFPSGDELKGVLDAYQGE
jgi:hypothetical protein